jgi:hypothetical protein
VSGWGSYSFLFGPLVAFGTVGVFVLILRWACSHGGSLVQRRPGTGSESEYGLLVPVAAPATFVEAEMLRRRLIEHNIRATLAPTTDGPRVMVFPDELRAAQAVLRS